MTNPNNAVGTNAAYSGRTSVNAFNDVLSAFTGRGILSGWACVPDTGMTVALGGNGTDRDAAIAEDNSGNFTTVNNISASPISVTLPAAPATNSRIDSIVAYVVKPPVGVSTEADNPQACGLIAVSGTVSASPSAPGETAIRSAITADGAAGNNAYYVVLADVLVGAGVTTVTDDAITTSPRAVSASNLAVSSADSINIGTSDTELLSVEVPRRGNYYVVALGGGTAQQPNSYIMSKLKQNGTEVAQNVTTVVGADANTSRFDFSIATTISANAGDDVSVAVLSSVSQTARTGSRTYSLALLQIL